MTESFWIDLIEHAAPTIAAVAGLIVALRTNSNINRVHESTNAMHDTLMDQASKAGHAKGVSDERARVKAKS